MTDKNNSIQRAYSRRKFIKNTGLMGTAFAGSMVSGKALAENYTSSTGLNQAGHFSRLGPEFIYLNSGTEGSMPNSVIERLRKTIDQWAGNPTNSYETDEILGKHQYYNREKVARFLSVSKNNICLTDNTTMGLNMVILGLNFKVTDKVIITNHEHNAIVSPLSVLQEKTGLTVIKRDFPTANILSTMNSDELLEFLLPDTDELRGAKALCVSHVYPTTGARLPLEALRKKADALNIKYLIVDGAQAFGMVDISRGRDHITHTDFYACPGHKWLNGPPSTGILYIKNSRICPPEFYPILSQRMTKYSGHQNEGGEFFPMAEALQVRGCSNAPGFSAMLEAIKFQQSLGGAELIERQILSLSQKVKDFILSRSPEALVSPFKTQELLSGLTVFFPFNWDKPDQIFHDEKTANEVVQTLLKRNIQIRSIGFDDPLGRGQKRYALRVSTGVFNTGKQIVYFQKSLKEILKQIF